MHIHQLGDNRITITNRMKTMNKNKLTTRQGVSNPKKLMKRIFEKWLFWKTLTLILVLTCFLGCGDGIGNDSIIQTVIIKESAKEIKITQSGYIHIDVRWRLDATPVLKTDLVVIVEKHGVSSERFMVLVPNSQGVSDLFKTEFTFLSKNLTEDEPKTLLEIKELPFVYIVGEDLVVDIEELQTNYPMKTIGGHIIPKDYDFPIYAVGKPSQILYK